MKSRKCIAWIISVLIFALALSSCGSSASSPYVETAGKSGSEKEDGQEKAASVPDAGTEGESGSAKEDRQVADASAPEDSRLETETEAESEKETEEETEEETKVFSLFDLIAERKKPLAGVIRDFQEEYGKPSFTFAGISRVQGMGIVHAADLDGDGEEELVLLHPNPNQEDYSRYVLEIWAEKGGFADCLYSGTPYRMGVDNEGIVFMQDDDGNVVFLYDHEDSTYGRYVGRISRGSFEEVTELNPDDYESYYDRESGTYLIDGKTFTPADSFVCYCYNSEELTEEYLSWKNTIKESYQDALTAFGLAKEDGAKIYTPGISSLLDDEYQLVKITYVDPEGTVSRVREYEYDNDGNQIRRFDDDILREEKEYNRDGTLVYEVYYNRDGLKNSETWYNDNGDILEKVDYLDNERENWHYIYTYDEKGRLATATMGLGGLKEYYYNDDDVLVEARTVDPDTGEIVNTHTFDFDSEGRPVMEYLNKDGMSLKFGSWEYHDDGTYRKIGWTYERYNEHVNMVYLEGEERETLFEDYDADDKLLYAEQLTFRDFSSDELVTYSTEEHRFDDSGKEIHTRKLLYNSGQPAYEEVTDYERTEEGTLVRRSKYYRNYGIRADLGEAANEISYVEYEAELNEQGYRIHASTWDNDDPYSGAETVPDEDLYYLYENAFGDFIGIDY